MKYFAGLFDADGSFTAEPRKLANGNFRIQLRATLYQLDKANVIREFSEYWESTLQQHPNGTYNTSIRCKKAQRFMEQVKNHLIVKRPLVEYLLEINGEEVNPTVWKVIKKHIKELRSNTKLKKPYPSRQWCAGYIDGDGCLISHLRKDGNLSVTLVVSSIETANTGIQLLHKFFGGQIYNSMQHGKNIQQWRVYLSESNCKTVLGYFGKHLRIKKAQSDYVLGYIGKGKHFKRRGATTEQNLKFHKNLSAMKRPQRLSDLDTYKV